MVPHAVKPFILGILLISTSGFGDDLPFIGRREFNFFGGTGTGFEITIKKNGDTKILVIGVCEISKAYQGKFSERIPIGGGEEVIVGPKTVKRVLKGKPEGTCKGAPCETKLSTPEYPPLKVGFLRC